MGEYQEHQLSSLLPMMGLQEIRELAADIQANGLRAPITLLDGQVLDGRNRLAACRLAGVEPKFRDFNGAGDPLDFIVSVNVKRRHLTTGQRAMVAAKLARMPRGDISRFSQQSSQTAKMPNGKTNAQAAKELEVSERSVRQAKEVLRTAPVKEVEAVERGEKKVSTVARETREKAAAKEKHLDKTGFPIPEGIFDDWRRAEEFSAILRDISRIKGTVEKALEEGDIVFAEVSNTTVAAIKNLYGDLKRVLPHSVCTSCQGLQRDKCTLCKGRGFISDFTYTTCVPKDTKTLREKAVQHK